MIKMATAFVCLTMKHMRRQLYLIGICIKGVLCCPNDIYERAPWQFESGLQSPSCLKRKETDFIVQQGQKAVEAYHRSASLAVLAQ